MLRGDLGAVAEAGMRDGLHGVNSVRLQSVSHSSRCNGPPPASPRRSSEFRPAIVEWKLDGARVGFDHAR
jgi:hypothetical protein